MPTAQGGDRPLGWFKQLARWSSHYTHWFLVVALACSIASGLTTGTLAWILIVPGLAWAIPVYGDIVHIKHWDCPQCVERAPIFDGPERAQEHLHALRFIHDTRWKVWAFGVGYGSMIGLPFLIDKLPWRAFETIPFYLVWGYLCWAGIQHRDLRRWCPWCRRGRDDDGPVEVVPPTPVAENTR
jgi:hypothetical protein